ncbi:MAG: hypothetical protein RIG62_16070 [Cyclobacteriaceae bacterium]
MKKLIIIFCAVVIVVVGCVLWKDALAIRFFQVRQLVLNQVMPQRDLLIAANGFDSTFIEDRSIIELERVTKLNAVLSENLRVGKR